MDTNLDSFFMFFVVESVRLGRFSDESMRRAIQMIKVLFRGYKLEEVDRTKEDKKIPVHYRTHPNSQHP